MLHDDIYYLIHVTNDSKCLHPVNWKELKTSNFNTDDQFPGVYFTLITKYNIDYEKLFPGKYILIFSKNLLYQHNYHINLTDYNGIITEKNTYYPWNIDKFVIDNKLKCIASKKSMNEVIFHDNIDMKYCCCIKNKDNDLELPRISYVNNEPPDLTKIPFYCFPFNDIYTGCNPQPPDYYKWYSIFAKIANINCDNLDNINDKNEIIKKIKEKAFTLYNNRNEQKINILYEYTMR